MCGIPYCARRSRDLDKCPVHRDVPLSVMEKHCSAKPAFRFFTVMCSSTLDQHSIVYVCAQQWRQESSGTASLREISAAAGCTDGSSKRSRGSEGDSNAATSATVTGKPGLEAEPSSSPAAIVAESVVAERSPQVGYRLHHLSVATCSRSSAVNSPAVSQLPS